MKNYPHIQILLQENLFEYAAKTHCTGTTNQLSVKFVRPHSTNHFIKLYLVSLE